MDFESQILDLIEKTSSGVTNKMLQDSIPSITVPQMVEALNKLMTQDKIEIFKQGKQLLYKLKDKDVAKKFKGADNEEKLIYQIIEKAGNKGIWIRDLRFASNLSQTQVNKILKNLENKKLIKSVKSVAASKKKVYMLYNIEPDRTVTGGTWYSDQEFESEFVEVLNQQCFRFLQQAKAGSEKLNDPISQRNASYKSSKDICSFINGLKVSKVQLSVQDIETILDTLIYDGKVEKSVIMSTAHSSHDQRSENIYRAVKPLIASCGLMRMPCGVCLVVEDCYVGGVVSPSTCQYMKEWLEF